MNNSEFYLNLPTNHECFKLPEKDKKYLLKNNYLGEFFSDNEKAEARFNLGLTPILNELKALIYAKLVDEAGNLKFGLEPTNGEESAEAYSEVLSSAVIYNTLLKYYTKDEINGLIENLEEQLSKLGIVDENLNEESKNPVLNKVITNKLGELSNGYNRLSNTKADKEELLNYNTIDEIAELLQQLRDELIESQSELIAGVQNAINNASANATNIGNYIGQLSSNTVKADIKTLDTKLKTVSDKVDDVFEILKNAGISSNENSIKYIMETTEDGFFIVDESLNVGVKVDNNGIHSKNIVF